MSEPAIIAYARMAHEHRCDAWRGIEHPGLAHSFGRPENMPPHRWRVSWDMMQALTEAAPPPFPAENAKTAEGATKLLFGWPIARDDSAGPGLLVLERAVG